MKSKVIEVSNNHCKKCNKRLYWKEHPKVTAKELKRPYYFSKWEYCLNGCKAVWHHEEFKVWNKNDKALQIKNYEEIEQQNNFLRSL